MFPFGADMFLLSKICHYFFLQKKGPKIDSTMFQVRREFSRSSDGHPRAARPLAA